MISVCVGGGLTAERGLLCKMTRIPCAFVSADGRMEGVGFVSKTPWAHHLNRVRSGASGYDTCDFLLAARPTTGRGCDARGWDTWESSRCNWRAVALLFGRRGACMVFDVCGS